MPSIAFRPVAAVLFGTIALGGCTTYDRGYGYGGVEVGYASPAAYGPYWGWYDNYYYPGVGLVVYDRYRRPIPWNDHQRAYWQGRQAGWQAHYQGMAMRENWGGFHHHR